MNQKFLKVDFDKLYFQVHLYIFGFMYVGNNPINFI